MEATADAARPLLSVVIPTYNRAGLIGPCVESVLAQDYRPIEVIVVDDGSTDNTPQMLAAFGPAIRVLTQPNSGQAQARVAGLRLAQGAYLSLLDSDDRWLPGFASTCIAYLESSTCSLVCPNYQTINRQGTLVHQDSFRALRPRLAALFSNPATPWAQLDEARTRDLYIHHFPPGATGPVFRRSLVTAYPNPSVTLGDDYLFFTDNVLAARCSVAFCQKPLFQLCASADSIRQGSRDYDRIGSNDVFTKRELLRKHGALMNAEQRAFMTRRIADDFFDWGYAAGHAGDFQKSFEKYSTAFVTCPRMKTGVAMAKAALRLALAGAGLLGRRAPRA